MITGISGIIIGIISVIGAAVAVVSVFVLISNIG